MQMWEKCPMTKVQNIFHILLWNSSVNKKLNEWLFQKVETAMDCCTTIVNLVFDVVVIKRPPHGINDECTRYIILNLEVMLAQN